MGAVTQTPRPQIRMGAMVARALPPAPTPHRAYALARWCPAIIRPGFVPAGTAVVCHGSGRLTRDYCRRQRLADIPNGGNGQSRGRVPLASLLDFRARGQLAAGVAQVFDARVVRLRHIDRSAQRQALSAHQRPGLCLGWKAVQWARAVVDAGGGSRSTTGVRGASPFSQHALDIGSRQYSIGRPCDSGAGTILGF